jgi:hypothetical protein
MPAPSLLAHLDASKDRDTIITQKGQGVPNPSQTLLVFLLQLGG